MKNRVVVVAIIKNDKNHYLLCKKPENLGVYAGKWGLIGGGLDKNETINQALKREVKEETSLSITSSKPLHFSDDTVIKLLPNGEKEKQYLIYLYFEVIISGEIKLNHEWETYVWVKKEDLSSFDLGDKTIETFQRLQIL